MSELPARLRNVARQEYARRLEVVDLAQGCGQELRAVLGIQKPARDARAHLIGVADAIGAHVAVGAKQLDEVQIRQRGIKERQIILRAVRGIHVQHARLEREEARAFKARIALKQKSGVDARRRQSARRRAVHSRGGIG